MSLRISHISRCTLAYSGAEMWPSVAAWDNDAGSGAWTADQDLEGVLSMPPMLNMYTLGAPERGDVSGLRFVFAFRMPLFLISHDFQYFV